ncbi:MAG: CerR family C-terminal domain-containing protein [Phycisphaerales bacterium JB060]
MARRDPDRRHRRPPSGEAQPEGTRERLIEAAGDVFASKGYHAATVKDITDLAGAAIGSINYHFGDKEGLYAQVLARIGCAAEGIVPPEGSLHGTPRERLRQYLVHIMTTMLGREKPVWERVLMARELAEPTAALDSVIETIARPLHQGLAELVSQITGQKASTQRVALLTCGIVAQCMYYLQHEAVLDRVHPQLKTRPSAKRLADTIADFSIAGLERMTEGK